MAPVLQTLRASANADGGFGHGSGALVLFLAGSVEVSIQGSVPHGLHAPPALLQQCLPARHQVLVPINISEIPVPPRYGLHRHATSGDRTMTIIGEHARVMPDEPTQALWDPGPAAG